MPQYPANINLASLNGLRGFTLSGAGYDRSGRSVASAGDVDGDGFDDVIVGAPYANSNGTTSGASYVAFGKTGGFASNIDLSSLDGSSGFRLSGAALFDQSGGSVASAGDVNGDGFDDVIIGARYADPNGMSSGASYVVLGKAEGFASNVNLSSLDGSNGFKLSGAAADDRSGVSVASAGDVNGDGLDDLIVGARGADPHGILSGASYVVFGKAAGFASNIDLSSLDGGNGFRLSGAAAADYSGVSVASAGDVNGDGFDDVIVGASHADPNENRSGASYVVFGNASGFASNVDLSSLDGSNGFRLSGTARYDHSGLPVASAGDVNGDGFDDLIIGGHASTAGASYVVFGKAAGFGSNIDLSSLDGSNGFKLSGVAAYDRSGSSVASAGDVNGDGFDDVIVGAPYADPNGRSSGASYVVFGKATGFASNIDLSSLDGSNGFKLGGARTREYSGASVASAGDVDGDGFADLIVGAPFFNDYYPGASYVVFGRAPDTAVTRVGTDSSQTLAGGSFDDTLTGLGGDDRLHGHGGNDILDGGNGDDRLGGAVGDDALGGGNGHDTLFGAAGSDVLDGGDGDDRLGGGSGADHLDGGDGDDRYTIDDIGDTLTDTSGIDLVYTAIDHSLGADFERLHAGTDSGLLLTGNGADNVIAGRGGDDTITGGGGRDVMAGGAGGDTFVLDALSDSVTGGARDVIRDFQIGADKIDLAGIDANTGAGGNQPFTFIGAEAFAHTAGELQAKAFGVNTLVSGDVDGNGQADFQILLSGSVAVQATDFLL